MTSHFRSQLTAATNENGIPINNVKNGIAKGQVVPRLGLSARNTNLIVHPNCVKAPSEFPAKDLNALEHPEPMSETVCMEENSLPDNVVDIDEDDHDHLEFCAHYVKDIYDYLFKIETQNPISPQYLQRHPTLKPHMRMILIEWLVSLQARFKLLQETLLLTIATLDRYLSVTPSEVSRGKFQLVGISCLFVASKYEEMYLPSVSELAYMCDGAYTVDDIFAMERTILATLDFDFSKPLSAHFLRRCSKAGGADSLTHTIAKYFLELAVYDYNLVHCLPSVIAASSLYIAGMVTQVVDWNDTVEFYSRYKPEDLNFVVGRLAESGLTAISNKYLKTTFKKYAAEKFRRVAKLVAQSDAVVQLYKKHQPALV